MKPRAVGLLLALYRRVAHSGLLERPVARRSFEWTYLAYKRLLEAGPVSQLRNLVTPGSIVVDVGANIGYFSVPFGRWVGAEGRVLAIEPELRNMLTLRRRVAHAGLTGVVECVQAVAADRPGELRLAVNPIHPGDHHIAEAGEPIQAVTVDALLSDDPRPVALLKIDVQGAERMVLAGARRVIEANRPAIFLEVDNQALERMGTSASELVGELHELGYVGHRLERRGIGAPESRDTLVSRSADGYIDVLFLRAGTAADR